MRPQRLGRYQLLRHLASGGMARVYLARADGPGGFARHVVIKTIPAERRDDDKFIAMFLDEARLVATLHHQHIAQVFEVDRAEDGTYFLAMEYVHGETVRHVLQTASDRRVKLPVEVGLSIACAAAAGLHHAHERRDIYGTPLGIVHRDVSPSNLIVGFDGSIKLIDFGIAKATLRTTHTATGFIKGKAGYMAPEQARGYAVDRRSDVFALGVLAYELTTQTRAFHATSQFETLYRTTRGDVEPPTKRIPGYPAVLEDVIMTALELDPDDRFQDADAMRTAFEQIARELGVSLGESAVIRALETLFPARPEPWLVPAASADDDVTPIHIGSEPAIMVVPATPSGMRVPAGMAMAEAHSASELHAREMQAVPEHIAATDTLDLTTSPFERWRPQQPQAATARMRPRPAGPTPPLRTRATGTAPPMPAPISAPVPVPHSISAQLPLQPTLETPIPPPPLHEPATTKFEPVPEPRTSAPVLEARTSEIGPLPEPSDLDLAPQPQPLRSRTFAIAYDRRWSPLAIAGTALAILTVVAVVAMIATHTSSATSSHAMRATSTSAPTAPSTGSTTTAPTKAAATKSGKPLQAEAHAARPAGTVMLTVTSQPVGATVVLDGVRLGVTPFSAPVYSRPGMTWLKVRARNYAAIKTRVSLDRDVEWKIELRHLARR